MKSGTYKGKVVKIVRMANSGDPGFSSEIKGAVLIIDEKEGKLVVPVAEVMISAEGNV